MFSPIDNKVVGQNIAKLRRHRDVKAATIASKIGLTESAYTKYERGETAITLDFLNKVSEEFDVSPSEFINATPSNIIENMHDNAGSIGNIGGHSTVTITNNLQEKIVQSVFDQNKVLLEQNNRLTALLEKLTNKL